MPLDYNALNATAIGFIEQLGRAGVLMTLDGASEIPVTVLLTDYGARERDGALIARNDRRALIAATPGVAPDPEEHRLVIDGHSFRIVAVAPNKPADVVMYFDCQVRL